MEEGEESVAARQHVGNVGTCEYAIGSEGDAGKPGQHVGRSVYAIGTHCTYADDAAKVSFLGDGSSTYRVA